MGAMFLTNDELAFLAKFEGKPFDAIVIPMIHETATAAALAEKGMVTRVCGSTWETRYVRTTWGAQAYRELKDD